MTTAQHHCSNNMLHIAFNVLYIYASYRIPKVTKYCAQASFAMLSHRFYLSLFNITQDHHLIRTCLVSYYSRVCASFCFACAFHAYIFCWANKLKFRCPWLISSPIYASSTHLHVFWLRFTATHIKTSNFFKFNFFQQRFCPPRWTKISLSRVSPEHNCVPY